MVVKVWLTYKKNTWNCSSIVTDEYCFFFLRGQNLEMLLTGLNIDCLEEIFEYLELGDLLNAADSNKRMLHASKFVYVRKYGSHRLHIGLFCKCYLSKKSGETITVNNFKSILSLLRNFGPLISRISMDPFQITAADSHIHDYINYFCSKTLSYLRIRMSKNVLDCFKNPFTSVKTVHLHMGIDLIQKKFLVRLFPKMQKLTLIVTRFTHIEYIGNYFPRLEYIKLDTNCSGDSMKDNECTEVIKDFLRLNPQLKHLFMCCGNQADYNILQVFEGREQNPERLELLDVDDFFNSFNGKKLHLTNLKHLSINSYCQYPFMEGIPILCNHLETFEIELENEFNEHIYDFCQNNSSIRKLKTGNYSEIFEFDFDFSRLAQFLPLLEEFTNLCGKLSVDEALYVLSLFKLLKHFKFICSEHFECKQLQARLKNEWSMHFTTLKFPDDTFITPFKIFNVITLKR